MEDLGKIIQIKEIHDFQIGNMTSQSGKSGASMGMCGMINCLKGYGQYDGYLIKTDKHEYHLLISNEQNCCEDWGYVTSEDDFELFIGKTLANAYATDTALNKERIDVQVGSLDEGQIQFVDFQFADGNVLQFAVYNSHNGYYGHSIFFSEDGEILLDDTI